MLRHFFHYFIIVKSGLKLQHNTGNLYKSLKGESL